MTITGFQTYCLYLAISRHFKSSYDFRKYHGKVNVKFSTFENRPDKYQFIKLGKKYNYEEMVGLFVSHYSYPANSGFWVGDTLNPDFQEAYTLWQKRIQSITFHFEQDCRTLKELNIPFNDIFKCIDADQHPTILKQYLGGHISLETLIILDNCLRFIPHINKNLAEDFVWDLLSKRIVKYASFLHIQDTEKYRKIILSVFSTS